jgi:hypothetical protein
MTRTAVPPEQGDVVHQLINKFLAPAPGRSPARIKQRILDWIEKANHPLRFLPSNAGADTIAEFCRKARQNVRRLSARHPEVAAEIMATMRPEDLQ